MVKILLTFLLGSIAIVLIERMVGMSYMNGGILHYLVDFSHMIFGAAIWTMVREWRMTRLSS